MNSDFRAEPRAIWHNQNTRKVIQITVERLIASSQAPAALQKSVSGATSGWGMSFQDQLDFRFISASSDGLLSEADTMIVLSRMIAEAKASVRDFEEIFRAAEAEFIAASRNPPMWRFLLPFHAAIASDIELPIRLSILGFRFNITKFRSAAVGVSKIIVSNVMSRSAITPVCIVGKAQGISVGAAWQSLVPAFDALRGMIELTLGYGRTSLHMPPRAHASIPHPAWLIAWDSTNKTGEDSYFVVGERQKNSSPGFELSKRHLLQISANLRPIRKKPRGKNDIPVLIGDVLRLYVQSLDAADSHFAYLGMWQCIEALTLVGQELRGSGDIACARLSHFLGRLNVDSSGIIPIMRDLYKRRNDIVHRGLHDRVGQDDFNFLKTCCEVAIASILNFRRGIPTARHLARFYEFATVNDRECGAVADILRFLKNDWRSSAKH